MSERPGRRGGYDPLMLFAVVTVLVFVALMLGAVVHGH